MEFSFLEFWVPSFFRSKLKGSNTWLEYFGIYRLRSDCIFNTEGGFKIGTLSFRTFVLLNGQQDVELVDVIIGVRELKSIFKHLA